METAAKITERDEEQGIVTGEYWEDNEMYDMEVEKVPASGYLRVQIFGEEICREAYIEDRLDMHEFDGSRSLVALEGHAELPEDNTQLEALGRKVLGR